MAVEVSNLVKNFGDVSAVRGVSFQVSAGSMFAIAGENGAGKSTTVGCLTGALKPDGGHLHVAGLNPAEAGERVRERIGVVSHRASANGELSVSEGLSRQAVRIGLAASRAHRRIDLLAERLELGEVWSRAHRELSTGQRRRVDIARALLHEPSILFLDETTADLDSQARERLWSAIDGMRHESGLTVVLTSRCVQDLDRADRVCVINGGRVLAEGSPGELRARYSSSTLTLTARNPQLFLAWSWRHSVRVTRRGHDTFELPVEDAAGAFRLLTQFEFTSFEFRHGTMHDVFVRLHEIATETRRDATHAIESGAPE